MLNALKELLEAIIYTLFKRWFSMQYGKSAKANSYGIPSRHETKDNNGSTLITTVLQERAAFFLVNKTNPTEVYVNNKQMIDLERFLRLGDFKESRKLFGMGVKLHDQTAIICK